jgi:hydrogenase-4 component B
LLPLFYVNGVIKIVTSFIPLAGFDADQLVKFMNPVQSIGKYAVLFIAFTVVLVFLRYYFVKKNNVAVNPTWGGGHVKPSLKMQYTGKSFSKTLGKILSALVFERKNYKELAGKEYFPADRKHSAGYTDLFEFRIIDGSLNRIIYFMDRFQFIQNGKLQRYIVYGLVFIILVFLGTVFNLL